MMLIHATRSRRRLLERVGVFIYGRVMVADHPTQTHKRSSNLKRSVGDDGVEEGDDQSFDQGQVSPRQDFAWGVFTSQSDN